MTATLVEKQRVGCWGVLPVRLKIDSYAYNIVLDCRLYLIAHYAGEK